MSEFEDDQKEDLRELIESLRGLTRVMAAAHHKAPMLWTAEEVATWIHISPRSIHRVLNQPDFPAPFVPTGAVSEGSNTKKLWFADEVVEWARRHRADVGPRSRGRRPRHGSLVSV